MICAAWGGNFLFSALALQELPALLFTALRLSLVAILLLPWLRLPRRGQVWRLVAVCLCNGALHFGLAFWALRLAGNLSSPAIVMQTYVPLTVLLGIVLLGEKVGWRTTVGMLVSFTGVLLLGFDPLVLQAPTSVLLMLVSATSLALGTVLMRGLSGLHPLSLQAFSAWIGLPFLLLAGYLVEGDWWPLTQAASWHAWSGVLYSALIASVLGHSLFFWLVQRHPVSKIAPYLLITPLIAVILGVAFWGDVLGPRLMLGGSMVLGGVLVIGIRAAKRGRVLESPGSAKI